MKKGLKTLKQDFADTVQLFRKKKTYPNLMKEKPLWTGQDLKDKVLYTYYEAGFGDVLMFYRFMPQLTSMCKKLYLNPRKSLQVYSGKTLMVLK